MKLGIVRKIILEELDLDEDEFLFYSRLQDLAERDGGLRVTHESPTKNLDSILSRGIKNLDHGIYFTIGWYDDPVFVKDGVMFRVLIPARFVNSDYIVPDDRYGTGGYGEFLQENPEIVGGEIGTNFDLVPRSWIKEAIQPSLQELRNYIRNVLAPDHADREQLKPAGKRGWDMGVLEQDPEDEINDDLTIDQGPRDLGLAINDPYVKQDRPAPTVTKMFGRTGP